VACSHWRDAVVSSSPEAPFAEVCDELASVLAFHGQHAFALGTAIANWPGVPDLGERWPSRLVATAAEDRLSFRRNLHTSFAAASDCGTIPIYEYPP